jgi:hypothetical protein
MLPDATDAVTRFVPGTGRVAHVYALDIIYPEGSHEPGWRPPGWKPRLGWRRPGFRWPRERTFLSASGARRRAGYLISCGAEVMVLRSDPVTWHAGSGCWEDEAAVTGTSAYWTEFDASGLPVTEEDLPAQLLAAWGDAAWLFGFDPEAADSADIMRLFSPVDD